MAVILTGLGDLITVFLVLTVMGIACMKSTVSYLT
jgi:hypothetical protein